MMEFTDLADALRGIPHMTEQQGRAVYKHVRETKPEKLLELGTAHGVSACYIAGALEANGFGSLISVDRTSATYDPHPEHTLRRTGLDHRVELIRIDHSSYTWFLKDEVERRSDRNGNCAPVYDFAFLDGAHNWTIDGLAVVLLEKLLRSGGWLLLDDLSWTYAAAGAGEEIFLSEDERSEPHMRYVYELLVQQLPTMTDFRVQADLDFGWARKRPGELRRYSLETSESVGAALLSRARRARMEMRATLRSARSARR
jgi:predicted O-methyltransferase YrrM